MPLHVQGEMTLTCGWTTCNLKMVSQDVSARNLSFLAIRERATNLLLSLWVMEKGANDPCVIRWIMSVLTAS